MLAAMGDRRVCILRGHGITVAGESIEQATVTAIDLDELCRVTVRLAELGASPPADQRGAISPSSPTSAARSTTPSAGKPSPPTPPPPSTEIPRSVCFR